MGFNVVLPSMRSIFSIGTAIKAHPNPLAIVVGPSVNACSFRNAAANGAERKCWDYEIRTAAGANFSVLVTNVGQDLRNFPAGIVTNECSDPFIGTGRSLMNCAASTDQPSSWPDAVFLDRRAFFESRWRE